MGIYDCWWEREGDELAAEVDAIGKQLWDADASRRFDAERNLRRFGAKILRGLFLGGDLSPDQDNLRLNITKSAIETLVSKVGSNRPRPRVLTSGGNWGLRARAKKLQRFLDGSYKQANVYKTLRLVVRDCLLTGTGIIHAYPHLGKRQVMAERVFPLEVLVDPVEAVDGAPQNLWRVKFIDKNVLKGMLPKKAKAIEALASIDEEYLPAYMLDVGDGARDARANRMVMVFEAWHLAVPALDGSMTPGRHVVAAGNTLLADEPWDYDFFPFSMLHWCPPVRGFWGDSAAGEIRGLEREVNTLLQKVQRAMKLAGQPWILNPNGGKVAAPKITNEAGLIVQYEGAQAPTIVTHQPVHPQIMEQMWTLQQKAYQQLGTNEYQSAAVKPPGIESGRGLEQLSEEHLVRFKAFSLDLEDMVACDLARQMLQAAKRLDDGLKALGHSEGYVVRANSNRTQLKIKWADACISPDDFFIETWPTSVLPITPSGRAETVANWQSNGWISPQRAMSLLDLPDLDSELDLATADSELVEWQLEQMLDEDIPCQPEERQNLQYALQRGTYALEKAIQDGAPFSAQDNVRLFLAAIEDILSAKNPVPPPAPMGTLEPGAGPSGPMPLAPATPPGMAPPPGGVPGGM